MEATTRADGMSPTSCRVMGEKESSPFLPEYISATMSQVQRLKDEGARLFLVLQDLGVVPRPEGPPPPNSPKEIPVASGEALKERGARDMLQGLRQGLEDAASAIESARVTFEHEVI